MLKRLIRERNSRGKDEMKNKKNFSRIAGNLDIGMERKLAKSKNKRIKRKAS